MSFPGIPENWDPNDERARGLINEWLLNVQGALARERARVDEIIANSGIVKPGPFVGHPGQPTLGTCAGDAGSPGASFVTSAEVSTPQTITTGVAPEFVYDTELQDDDGMFAPPTNDFIATEDGDYLVEVTATLEPNAALCLLGFRLDGLNVGGNTQGTSAEAISHSFTMFGVTVGQTISCYMSTTVELDATSVITLTRNVPATGAHSQCLAVNFSGVPGHIQIPIATYELLAYQLLTHWGEWEDRGNGDVYLALFSAASAGTPGFLDLIFTVGIPRGFTGWATNAIVLRYRLGFTGLAGATTISASLTVIDTRNDNESTPVPVFSEADHDEAGGNIDVPYGAELTVTKDQLATLAGFREGTAMRVRFRLSLPGVHSSAVIGVGHLELNYS